MSIHTLLTPLKRKLRQDRNFYLRFAPVFGTYRNLRMRCARLFRGYDDNLVVFSAFDNRSYNDSPRYISEALHAARPETDIVWLFKDAAKARAAYDLPDYVRALDSISASGVSALARARVVVDNFNKRFYLSFPGAKQTYIQTWHGDRPFKKIGYDVAGYNKKMIEEHSTLVLCGSDFGERALRSAFHYKGEVQKLGCPRNDLLVQNDPAIRAEIRARLGIAEEERALIYAPTFRDSAINANEKQRMPLDLNHVLDTLERTTGHRWKCLYRAHYMSLGFSDGMDSQRLIPASDYPEMAELLLASDALMTDYSSCASDFVLLRRPIYLYQDDVDEYQNRDRAFYYPMSDYDYWIAHTPEELDALIEQTTPERAAENCDRIIAFYDMAETGRSTEATVDYIISKLQNK